MHTDTDSKVTSKITLSYIFYRNEKKKKFINIVVFVSIVFIIIMCEPIEIGEGELILLYGNNWG